MDPPLLSFRLVLIPPHLPTDWDAIQTLTSSQDVLYTRYMLKNNQRWWDFPAAFFLTACLMTVAFRLGDTKWTENLGIVTTLTMLATILGLVLGYSRFKGWLATLFAIAFTLFFIPWQLGLLITGDVQWTERLISIGGRIWNGFQLFLKNQPLTDPLPFLTNMAVLLWLVSIIAGYNLTRRGRPWLGLVISGITLVVIDIYHPELAKGGFAMGVFVIFALLLITRIYFLTNSHQWQEQHITVDSDTGWSFGRGALVTAVLMVLLAWNITTVAKAFTPATTERQDVLNFWSSLRQRYENITAPLRGSVPVPVEFYSNEFSLGTGAILGDQPVMTVDPSITRRLGINYYWKMRSYDRYVAGVWISTADQVEQLTPTDPSLQYGDLQGRLPIRFHFRSDRNLSMLFAPSLPLTVSRPVTLIYKPGDSESIDVSAVEIDPILRAGESYEVYSWISAPTTAELKAAGSDYPAWLTDTYLQLPFNLPDSIKKLALEITDGLTTPYEKTSAITAWLRKNIEYSAVIPTPPVDQDPIEWVLFTEKKAFCNYYATAEVLMLRSLGIPARWVVGYAQGQLNEQKGYYQVLEKDSHAWPEVYFPGYGWIEFEPTASQPAIDRPSGDNASSTNPFFDPTGGTFQNDPRDRSFEEDPNANRLTGNSGTQPKSFLSAGTAVILVSVLLLIAAALFFIRLGKRDPHKAFPVLLERALHRRGWRTPTLLRLWASHVRLLPIERAFVSVEWVTRFMGGPPNLSLTPSEQAAALMQRLPQAEPYASLLLEEYQKAIYSPYPADLEAARQASRDLWKLAVKTRLKNAVEFLLSGQPQPKART